MPGQCISSSGSTNSSSAAGVGCGQQNVWSIDMRPRHIPTHTHTQSERGLCQGGERIMDSQTVLAFDSKLLPGRGGRGAGTTRHKTYAAILPAAMTSGGRGSRGERGMCVLKKLPGICCNAPKSKTFRSCCCLISKSFVGQHFEAGSGTCRMNFRQFQQEGSRRERMNVEKNY